MSGVSALHASCASDHVNVVRLLKHSDVNLGEATGCTALMESCAAGSVASTKLLLAAREVDVNRIDKRGRTALHHAAVCGKLPTVKLLLAAPGVNIHIRDEKDRTARYAAVSKGHEQVACALDAFEGACAGATEEALAAPPSKPEVPAPPPAN